MKKLLAIGVDAIVAGVLGAILLPVHVHVDNRDELARQERELVQRIAKEKRIDFGKVNAAVHTTAGPETFRDWRIDR